MSIFKKKISIKEKYLIYLVEDNLIYAELIKHSLSVAFGEKIELVHFPVAEVLDIKLESGNIPNMIIMDHYLSDKYPDAELGLTALKRIKKVEGVFCLYISGFSSIAKFAFPFINFHISFNGVDVNICRCVVAVN